MIFSRDKQTTLKYHVLVLAKPLGAANSCTLGLKAATARLFLPAKTAGLFLIGSWYRESGIVSYECSSLSSS